MSDRDDWGPEWETPFRLAYAILAVLDAEAARTPAEHRPRLPIDCVAGLTLGLWSFLQTTAEKAPPAMVRLHEAAIALLRDLRVYYDEERRRAEMI